VRSRIVAVHEPRLHELTGHPEQVANVLRLAHAQGRLSPGELQAVRASVVRHPDGRVSLQARLLSPGPQRSRWESFWDGAGGAWVAALGIGLAGAAGLLGLLLAVQYALAALVHASAPYRPLLLPVLVVLAVLGLLARLGRRRCPGVTVHCGDCPGK
jgi:hypothetical protein